MYSRALATPPGNSSVAPSTGAGAPSPPSRRGLMKRAVQSEACSSPASTVAGALQAERASPPLTRTRTATASREASGSDGHGTST